MTMKATPFQTVKSQHGGRAALVSKILPLLGGEADKAKSALMGTANKKLIRIYQVAQTVQKKFGTRKELVSKITALRYPTGNVGDGYVKKLEESTLKRLLDEYRQAGGK